MYVDIELCERQDGSLNGYLNGPLKKENVKQMSEVKSFGKTQIKRMTGAKVKKGLGV